MRRALLACMICLLCAPAAGAVAPAGQPPRATLTGFICQRASNQLDRAIQVWGQMRPVAETRTMQMRFVLLRRWGSAFSPVRGGGVGRWGRDKPGTELYRVKRTVVNLPAPGVYRFSVTFRWIAADGSILSHMTLLSSRCRQS